MLPLQPLHGICKNPEGEPIQTSYLREGSQQDKNEMKNERGRVMRVIKVDEAIMSKMWRKPRSMKHVGIEFVQCVPRGRECGYRMPDVAQQALPIL